MSMIKAKFLKLFCLIVRASSRRLYLHAQKGNHLSIAHKRAILAFCWADHHLCNSLARVFIIPGVMFRCAAGLLYAVIRYNSISLDPVIVHNKALGAWADRMLHKIPDQFCYPKMTPFEAPSISQSDG